MPKINKSDTRILYHIDFDCFEIPTYSLKNNWYDLEEVYQYLLVQNRSEFHMPQLQKNMLQTYINKVGIEKSKDRKFDFKLEVESHLLPHELRRRKVRQERLDDMT